MIISQVILRVEVRLGHLDRGGMNTFCFVALYLLEK